MGSDTAILTTCVPEEVAGGTIKGEVPGRATGAAPKQVELPPRAVLQATVTSDLVLTEEHPVRLEAYNPAALKHWSDVMATVARTSELHTLTADVSSQKVLVDLVGGT